MNPTRRPTQRPLALLGAFAVLGLAAFGIRQGQAPQPIKFARFPHIANDGRIAFTYQDDIWVADADGANARRLTANVARDFGPKFSPDGQWIAFTSNRTGNNDVYVIPAAGGEPKQLTWFSGDDQALYWTPDGKQIIIASNRGPNAFGSPLYLLPLDGAPPTPMAMANARAGMMNQAGTMLAFNRTVPSTWRKGFRGNATSDVAVMNVSTGDIRQITDTNEQNYRDNVNDAYPMWGADGMIYFTSERDGTYNIWRVAAAGGAPQQVTHHKDGGVFNPSISPDGKHIIYQNDFDLYTVDVPAGQSKKLNIPLAFDPKVYDVELLTAENRTEGFSVAPGGDYLAVDYHGEIAMVPTDAGVGEKTMVTNSPWRDRFEEYSPDGKKIAYVSDQTKDEEVWVFDIATGTRTQLTHQPSEKANITWAPNSMKLAYEAANHIWEVDAAGGTPPRDIAFNPAGGFNIQQYGPDGTWMVYSRRDAEQNADVYVYDIRSKKEYDVAGGAFNETSAALTPDGKTLVFTSSRDAATNQLFVVSLAKLAEDPADPLVRERVRRSQPAGGRGGRGAAAAADAADAAPLQVDMAGIDKRVMQLTRGTVGVGSFFISADGRTVIYATGGGGFGGGGRGRGAGAPAAAGATASLNSVSIDGRDRRTIASGTFAGMTPTADRRTIFFRGSARGAGEGEDAPAGPPAVGFEVHRLAIPAGGAAGGGAGGGRAGAGAGAAAAATGAAAGERINFSFTVRVNHRDEWRQIFDEAWRVMKYRYYDSTMHHRDWAALKAKYEPLVQYVGTNEDVYDLGNAIIGEINSSHTGVTGPPTVEMPRVYTTHFLGFEMEPANGKYRVNHVYRNGPADKEWIDINVGDYIQAIDGHDLKSGDNYWKILNEVTNEYVPVKVSKTPAGENAKVFRIASVTNLTNIKYDEWVATNRDSVDKATNGQIAYVHIRAMDQPSLTKFENEIDQFWQKKGIIIDIRNNGGGNIDQEILDILERKPYQFWNNRNGVPTWGRRPRQAIVGPKILMTNYRSVSDAEVTPQGFRALNLGKIVGNTTSAQVIATGSYALINGGAVRTPGSLVVTWDPTKPNNFGEDMEGLGVPPDVWVKNSLQEEARGSDRELRTAISEALKAVKATTPPKPATDK